MITTLGMHQRDRVVASADLHSDQPTILISYLGRRRPLISCGRDDPELRLSSLPSIQLRLEQTESEPVMI
jgi:hypothetical protein